jgi:hypothetical protein
VDLVGAAPAVDAVAAVAGEQGVAAGVAEDAVVALAGVEDVLAAAAPDGVVAGEADDDVVAVAADEQVVPVAAIDRHPLAERQRRGGDRLDAVGPAERADDDRVDARVVEEADNPVVFDPDRGRVLLANDDRVVAPGAGDRKRRRRQ